MFAVLGFGAVVLGRDPNGLANLLFGLGRRSWTQFAPKLPGQLHRCAASDSAYDEPEEVPAHAAS